jgi:DNA-binding response OmpR family regulator
MKKLLLVDDDENLLKSLSRYLTDSGFEVLFAKNGKEGLRILEEYEERISLVVTDIVMPSMGGMELCRKIRQTKSLKKLPLIMLTSMSDISDKYLGYTSGADDYLTKPFEELELLLKIQVLIKRTLPEEETPEFSSVIKMNRNTHSIIARGNEIYLSSLEFDILYYLYTNPKRLISIEEFFKEVFKYPPDTGNSDNIRAHIKNIRAKIEENPNIPKIITNIPRRGYMFNP